MIPINMIEHLLYSKVSASVSAKQKGEEGGGGGRGWPRQEGLAGRRALAHEWCFPAYDGVVQRSEVASSMCTQ